MNGICPCGSNIKYADCCGVYITAKEAPVTAEALMRSRYVAFANSNEDYLISTWHPSTRPENLSLDISLKWISLKVESVEQGGAEDSQGTVEFTALSKYQGKAQKLHEVSQFTKVTGRWYYVGGIIT